MLRIGLMITIDDVIDHVRNRPYMGGVERDKVRIKQTEEIFTPDWLVDQCIDDLVRSDPTAFLKPLAIFEDPCCGDGQILAGVLIRKMRAGTDFETALKSLRGIDIMIDNVQLCRERLLCGQTHLIALVEKNIVCADALRYHRRWDGSHPYDDEIKQKVNKEIFGDFFRKQK